MTTSREVLAGADELRIVQIAIILIPKHDVVGCYVAAANLRPRARSQAPELSSRIDAPLRAVKRQNDPRDG